MIARHTCCYVGVALALSIHFAANRAQAVTIKFDDLTDTLNAFVDNNANADPGCSNVSEASANCIVRIPGYFNQNQSGYVSALFRINEPDGKTLSDAVGFASLSVTPSKDLLVSFLSDPRTDNVQNFYGQAVTEDGTYQNVTLPPDLPAGGALTVQFRSDVQESPEPVPEPASLLLLGTAIAGLLAASMGRAGPRHRTP